MIMTTWNPRYYPTLLESLGFTKAKDLLAYFFPMQGERAFEMPDRYRVHAERALRGQAAGLSRSRSQAVRAGGRALLGDLQLGVGRELGVRPHVARELSA